MQDAEFMDSNRAQIVTKLIRLHLSGYRREMRVVEVFLAACLMGAGYCLFGLILSIAGATGNSPDFLKATDWPIWVSIFGLTGFCLFVFAFSRLLGIRTTAGS
ncbi:hypothetical protein [Steroidobacter sp.]|uniref:hypothetical protein n=1 Tax=Steroidobacter sp. TaxID=1978227 RepID=UPI001A6343F3|nr:hypothetical protein [Steroidobacter sp.]MBL8270822.1 hypothetical protein [Steroidobacter sp.]